MKYDLEYALTQTAPENTQIDLDFTERVMNSLPSRFQKHMRQTPRKRQGLWQTLRHLPKFALVIFAMVAVCALSAVTYAVVQTVTHANVTLKNSGINEHGREQLSVDYTNCSDGKNDTVYELKKKSGLSAEDGAKALQARCEINAIRDWLSKDPGITSHMDTGMIGALASPTIIKGDTVTHITSDTISLKDQGQKPFPASGRVIIQGQTATRDQLKPGDGVAYVSLHAFDPILYPDPATDLVIFKLSQPAKYYGLLIQSYIDARAPCRGNPTINCLAANTINTVILKVANGPAYPTQTSAKLAKQLQGTIVSFDSSSIKLDVGNNTIYTVQTRQNLIGQYNDSTVYGLKDLDEIYAKTDPKALKIAVGDSLEIYYEEDDDQSSHTIPWANVTTVMLMVERTYQDMTVLEKY